jgi:hypothetical protein
MTGSAPCGDAPSVWVLIFGDGTPRRAFWTAIVVGTLLTMINHGDLVIAGTVPPMAKVALTYLVPYCVATWGAVCGKRALLMRGTARRGEPPPGGKGRSFG